MTDEIQRLKKTYGVSTKTARFMQQQNERVAQATALKERQTTKKK